MSKTDLAADLAQKEASSRYEIKSEKQEILDYCQTKDKNLL